MSRTVSPSSGRPYGLARVCRVWRAVRATIYRHRLPPRTEPPRQRGPVGSMPDPALAEAIRAVLAASPFHGEGHRKVWATLAGFEALPILRPPQRHATARVGWVQEAF